MIDVHYFAGLKELTGHEKERVDCSGQTVEQLKALLMDKYPGIEGRSIQVAVNEEYALPGDVLAAGDVVALIPPVSGG